MNTQSTKKNQIGKKYYCPNCKLLFKENKKYYECNDLVKGKQQDYLCLECSNPFTNITYKTKSKNRKCYNFGKNSDKNKNDTRIFNPVKVKLKKEIENYISNIITELWEDGYNINEIHTHTHFSETRIKEVIQDFKREHQQEYTFEEFEQRLSMDIQEGDYPLIQKKDIKKHKVRKFLKMGFSVLQISKILRMSNTTISRMRRIPYQADHLKKQIERDIENQKRYNSLEEKYKVINPRSTQPIKISQEEQQQIDRFLDNAIPQDENYKKQHQRNTIIIDEDKKTILIKGMTKEERI